MARPAKTENAVTITQARAIVVGLVFSAVLCPGFYQPLLTQTWRLLRETSFYQWSTFETLWTVVLYAWIEVRMTSVFIKHPEWRLRWHDSARAKPRGMRRPSRRIGEITIYVLPLLAMDLTMVKKFAGVPLSDMLATGNYQHDMNGDNTNPDHGTLTTLPRTFLIPTFHNFSMSSPLQLVRALPTVPPSSRRLVLELVASFAIYDFLFFLFHLALHVIRPLRSFHALHHAHDAQLNPQVTNQLSVAERLGLVMLANFSLNTIGAHVLTRTLFVPLFVWLLVEIHCGMDLPWGYEKILPRGWAGGARKHMQHHRTGEGGFEPFFCWWDALWERWGTKEMEKTSRQNTC